MKGEASREALLLRIQQGDVVSEFRAGGAYVIGTRQSPDGVVRCAFISLEEGVRQFGALDLKGAYEGEVVDARLAVDELTPAEVVAVLQSVNRSFSPHELLVNITGDPPLLLNALRYYAIEFDDGCWEFVEAADQYSVIARCSIEVASMVSGIFEYTVGRVPSGHVVLLEDLDDLGERVTAIRRPLSNVEAVRYWLTIVDDTVRLVFEAAYRNGASGIAEPGPGPGRTNSFHVDHDLHLTPDELRDLWG